MQTSLPPTLLDTPDGQQADRILRSCVHCGFCTATCPTYLETGNELDSPRGRIYLIKELLESGTATRITQIHLDRCLSCQSCETTCPSDVNYHQLLDIGRRSIGKKVKRPLSARLKRKFLLAILGSRSLFALLVSVGRAFRFLLPQSLEKQLSATGDRFPMIKQERSVQSRKVILLDGCVQSSLSPSTNKAAQMVLNRLGIESITLNYESCCGAMHYHSDQQTAGLRRARLLIDQLNEALAEGYEAIISTASGCGNFIKQYHEILGNDPQYATKTETVTSATRDIVEYLGEQDLSVLNFPGNETLAFHAPCTLQHGQKLAGHTEKLLRELGFTVPAITDAHICCGSAGTYSLFQPKMSAALRGKKLEVLGNVGAEKIATANIGCQCHLASESPRPVRHWIEYVAEALGH